VDNGNGGMINFGWHWESQREEWQQWEWQQWSEFT
jgi:hypothetical protein